MGKGYYASSHRVYHSRSNGFCICHFNTLNIIKIISGLRSNILKNNKYCCWSDTAKYYKQNCAMNISTEKCAGILWSLQQIPVWFVENLVVSHVVWLFYIKVYLHRQNSCMMASAVRIITLVGPIFCKACLKWVVMHLQCSLTQFLASHCRIISVEYYYIREWRDGVVVSTVAL